MQLDRLLVAAVLLVLPGCSQDAPDRVATVGDAAKDTCRKAIADSEYYQSAGAIILQSVESTAPAVDAWLAGGQAPGTASDGPSPGAAVTVCAFEGDFTGLPMSMPPGATLEQTHLVVVVDGRGQSRQLRTGGKSAADLTGLG